MTATPPPDPADHLPQGHQDETSAHPDQDQPPGHNWFTILTEAIKPGLTALHQDCTCTARRTIYHRSRLPL